MTDKPHTTKPITLHSMKYWAGYDGSKRNLLGFPKMIRIFKTKREAMKHFDLVYQITINGEI